MKVVKFKNSNRGGGLVMALVATSALITATVLVTRSGGFQRGADLDTKQRQIISKTLATLKSDLADLKQCTTAMNLTTPFSTVGGYSAGKILGSGITLKSITSTLSNRVYTINIVFKKENKISKSTTTQITTIKAKRLHAQPPLSTDTCISFETTGAEESFKLFCQSTGGDFDNTIGTCEYDASNQGLNNGAFRTRLAAYACSLVGGNFNGTHCDKVTIPGPIFSTTYFPPTPSVNLGTDKRTAYVNFECPIGQIALGFSQDGRLSCSAINCNAFTSKNAGVYSNYSVDTSLYASSKTIMCKCNLDFKFGQKVNGVNTAPLSPVNTSGIGCAMPDQNSCVDYYNDDGCGTGTKCLILRGKYPGCSRTTTEKAEVLINSCGDICAVGPGCTTSGSCPTPAPLPPSTLSCSGGTYSNCILPPAGGNSTAINGSCSINPSITCLADCNASGNWQNINTSSCVANPINGECSTTASETCNAGTYSNQTDNASSYLWSCIGISGGTTAACSFPKTITGLCSTTTSETCTAGTYSNLTDSSTSFLWNCTGIAGGTTAACNYPKPPACGTTQNTCTLGTPANLVLNASTYTWNCNNGSLSISCSSSASPSCDPGDEEFSDSGDCYAKYEDCYNKAVGPATYSWSGLFQWYYIWSGTSHITCNPATYSDPNCATGVPNADPKPSCFGSLPLPQVECKICHPDELVQTGRKYVCTVKQEFIWCGVAGTEY